MMLDRGTSNERLLALADFLDTVPRKRFDYAYWVGRGWEGKDLLECDSTACALGWATAMPQFRALGMRLVVTEKNGHEMSPQVAVPDQYIFTSQTAAMLVFGITFDEAQYLFAPGQYPIDSRFNKLGPDHLAGPGEVAEHLRCFVKLRDRPLELNELQLEIHNRMLRERELLRQYS